MALRVYGAVRYKPAIFIAMVALLGSSCERKVLGEIDFYGYQGLDTAAVKAALPFREGDRFPPPGVKSSDELRRIVDEKVKLAIGREPTDVSFVCCDARGNFMVYIGLRGASYRPAAFRPAPTGEARLEPAALKLNGELENAWGKAVMSGHATEDDSAGYALTNHPETRKLQLAIREYALRHEPAMLQVLAESADARHRAIAAHFLGYASQSPRQVDALVAAALDPADDVRNNAIRALAVLAGAKPELARLIPAAPFIGLLRSGQWSDHNKASLLLMALTESRDPSVLAQLRSEALDSLTEMAHWRSDGHAEAARELLERLR